LLLIPNMPDKSTKQLLAHNDLKTTLIKTHVSNKEMNTINPPQSHIRICTKHFCLNKFKLINKAGELQPSFKALN